MSKYISWLTIFLLVAISVQSKENVSGFERKMQTTEVMRLAAGCDPASAAVNLDINNVRARIMNGGDMWWDLVGTAMYEIPKVNEQGVSKKTSLFAGALWIGGYDEGKNLRAAAMTYRQNSEWDFFPGPLDTTSATIEQTDCEKWDKIWQVTREEIDLFIEKGQSAMTDNIRDWPGNGDPSRNQSKYMAPYVEVDQVPGYDPYGGDYPNVKGDQALWFVYNDKGNTHTATNSLSIGLEIQTMAFAFATNDEINNMTFYQQKIINRSKNKLTDMFFGEWVDADLGYAYDDYVGCDTTRSLGICYNGDDFDEGNGGYGSNPPSIGIDFFQGPLADANDNVDNDKDGTIDEPGEEIIMSKFIYYDNDFSLKGNPTEGIHYYYYLTGRFKNGQYMRFGGDGFNNVWDPNKRANYMFPDDPRKPKPSWSEVTSGNKPFDRRLLQSAGPFTLKPGAVNLITVGVVWARATSGGNTGSYDLLIIADDKAQKLYNNNFKLIDGPNAPDVTVQELNRELVLSLENTLPIERYKDSILNENYKYISYQFQGYQIYQLKNSTVTTAELDNPDKARLVARVDIKDGITQLVNRQYIPGLGIVPTEKVDINGDKGIKHTFSITSDAFSSGDAQLVNFKTYYFLVISYAHCNNSLEYEQYLAGRKNIEVYSGTPHANDIEFNGTKLQSGYGNGPEIKRLEGIGNGGQNLELTEESVNYILANNKMANPVYKNSAGPLNVKIFDPLKVPDGVFEIKLIDPSLGANPANFKQMSANAKWQITKISPSPVETYNSDTILGVDYEQVFPKWGFSVKVDKVFGTTSDTAMPDAGVIETTLEFADVSKSWLTGNYDGDANTANIPPWPYNWIRAGKFQATSTNDKLIDDAKHENKVKFMDPNEIWEKQLDGRIAPYGLVARSGINANGFYTFGPAYASSQYRQTDLDRLCSIDLVFTSDRTNNKWSKCIVVEMGEDENLNENGVKKHFLRGHGSWVGNNDIDNNGNPTYSSAENGRSWFPGYAINLETGERLNIIFGEDSYFKDQNGADMIWNPTYNTTNPSASHREIDKYPWGGKHWIYVMDSRSFSSSFAYTSCYDGGQKYYNFFKDNNFNPSNTQMVNFWSQSMYVMESFLAYPNELLSLKDGLIPTETKIRIRISKPYQVYAADSNKLNNNLPYYSFITNSVAMVNSLDLGKDAMEKINIVPNPYYAYSEYEKTQLDNRVKITNLPKKCVISIYTLNGSLVRRFNKAETDENHTTYLDWDLKNQAGIPVSSGLYIIHIDGFELGTKTLKWFGIMRPIDLDTF